MTPLDKSKNKAYTFLLPYLYEHKPAHKLTNNFKNINNVYIDDEYRIHCTNTSNKVIYSLKFDVKYIEQYKLFKRGRYTKFSPYFKLLILKFWLGNQDIKTVLFNTKDDRELLAKPILKLEHINFII